MSELSVDVSNDSSHQVTPQSDGLQACCRGTIEQLAVNNPMMVCDRCKKIIKCFEDDKSYRNYLRFCQSRRRKVFSTEFHGYKIIIFDKV